jgi:hypothetical protein
LGQPLQIARQMETTECLRIEKVANTGTRAVAASFRQHGMNMFALDFFTAPHRGYVPADCKAGPPLLSGKCKVSVSDNEIHPEYVVPSVVEKELQL